MARQAATFVRVRWRPGRPRGPEPVAFPGQAEARGLRMDEDLAQEIMQRLRRAREPVLESVLYERVRSERAGPLAPEHFLAVVERLLMQGRIRLSVERETRVRAQPPFQARYYRSAD